MTLFETTILSKTGVVPDYALALAAMTHENIFTMSQAAEDAVLRPRDCGIFGHDMRAALAARVAELAEDETLATYYLTGAGDLATIAEEAEPDAAQRLTTILTFVDKVSNQIRHTAAEDIAGLQAAGISDADIVRLCELVAFLAYQIRVVSGLRLMQETTL